MTTLQYKLVTIRKPHKCFGCLRKFEPGSKMFYWFGVDGSDHNSGYACETCEEIMSINNYDEWYEGDVLNCLNKDQTPEQYLTEIKQSKTLKP